jgi:hypothetical protein
MSSFVKCVTKAMGKCSSPPERKGKNLWYFSYGSNMSEEVFAKRRQIKSQESKCVKIPNYVLSYALDGLPYMEPCFATLYKREDYPKEAGRDLRPDVHGVAFKITESEFQRVLATEGGSGWNDGSCGGYRVSEVEALDYEGNTMSVLTLTNLPRDNIRGLEAFKNCPSQRYKNLVVNGARSSGVDSAYVNWLEEQQVYDTSKNTCCINMALIAQIILFLPNLLLMIVGRTIFLGIFRLEKPPWIVVRCLYLYSLLLKYTLTPCMKFICGSGYHNRDAKKKVN